ncbi:MAG: S41 family peptidase [Patescibacteria group bacterium]|nr:S41 family peptidase [Patescibacteria group bacterium]
MQIGQHKRQWGGLFLLGLLVGAGLMVGLSDRFLSVFAASSTTINDFLGGTQPSEVDAEQFWKAWRVLEENYIPTTASSTVPTEEERLWGAIGGLAASYGDPYTIFLPPSDAEIFKEDISGEFSGVGMELGLREGKLVVIAPLKSSPAERAGILSGDEIIGVDGRPTEGMAVDEAVKLIRGPKGEPVILTLMREGAVQPLEITVVRDTIVVPVINNYLRNDGVYMIELYSFSANSSELFRQALRNFVLSDSRKLILDLRGNPGGYLEAAVVMASFFLPVGEPVVTEDFKGKRESGVHRSAGYNVFKNQKLDMAILIDRGTASASEILAGALEQHGVATLVGSTTFGKGSVQELISLGGGAELKVTIARWLTPNGTSISEGGLTPNIEVERTAEDVKASRDPQLEAAVKWILAR